MTDALAIFRRLRALVACALLGLCSTACSYATVGSGEVGVVWTPEGKPRSLPEGQWGIGSMDRATIYNARSQEHEERLEVLAANGLRIIAAQMRSEVDRIRAQSAAETKRIDAQATDDYSRLVQQHMSDRVLQWQRIEAMKALATSSNAKVIMLGEGKGGTILDIK
jgi:hypothetical protein